MLGVQMDIKNSRIRDRLLLLLVALCFSAYFVLSELGLSSQFGSSKWDAQFPETLPIIAVGIFLAAVIFARSRWNMACMMVVGVFIMPRFAVGAFFGAKNLLHLNWIVAALFAAPPIAVLLIVSIIAPVMMAIQRIRKPTQKADGGVN
jgi:hypothetical protein